MNTRHSRELREAADPFVRLLRVFEPLSISDNTPLEMVAPKAWPTVGDLRRLVKVVESGGHDDRQAAGTHRSI